MSQENKFEVFPLGAKTLKFFKRWQGCLIAFVAAILYSLSFEPFGLSLLAWCSIAVFYLAGFRRQDKALLLYGLIFSLTHLFFSNWFLYPVHWSLPFMVSLVYSFLTPLWFYLTRKFYWKLIFSKPHDT